MRKFTMLTSAVGLALAGFVSVAGTAAAHHAEISTRCDSATGETIVSLNIVYPTGSATFGGESIPLNTPLERRITEPTQLVLDGPGTAYDDVQTVVPVQGCDGPPPPPNCDTSVASVVGSVAGFLAEHGYDGGSCFDYTVNVECGVATGSVTNQPQPQYAQGPFRLVWNEGEGIANPYGPSNFPAVFPEDYNGGSVTISYYIVGPEKDWFSTNSGEVPNYWGGIYGTEVIDTDCEQPVETTEPEVPETTEPEVPETTEPEAPETTTTVAPAPTTTVVDEDPPCEWEVPEGADYRDGFWFDAAGNIIGQAEFEDECVEFHAPVPANFVVAQAALPETK